MDHDHEIATSLPPTSETAKMTKESMPASKPGMNNPAESELVAFDHSAAGHQGIVSDASGSLIFKPCTQAEIDFYESAKDHPLFQAHMPTFMGSLSQHEDQEAVLPLLDPAAAAQDGMTAPAPAADPTPNLVKRVSWKPSGGKKLATGLAIVLENVAAGFQRPNVLDVKLGSRLWDDDAPLAKRQKLDEVAGRTTSGSLGFRVAGMRVWAGDRGLEEILPAETEHVEVKNGYRSYNKHYGQSFKADDVVAAFTTYFGGVEDTQDVTLTKVKGFKFRHKSAQVLIRRFIRELESIRYVLENEESRMYSASVLMVYEGDEDALGTSIAEETNAAQDQQSLEIETGQQEDGGDEDDEDDDDDEDMTGLHKVHEVRLIDFAHARWAPGLGPDENVLRGIRSLLRVFKDLVG